MIRPVHTDAELEACARIASAVELHAADIDQFRRVGDRLLLDERGGYAYVNHSSVVGSAYAMVRVAPEARRIGIGSGLVAAAAGAARSLGKESAWGVVQPDDADSLRFAEKHGFTEASRDVELTRRLRPGDGSMRDGIGELREEDRRGAYEVSVGAIPDMVTAGQAEARPYEDWFEEELVHAVAAFVAVEDGRVVGYATLQRLGEEPDRLEHGFTGVLPDYRRRGIATALGEAQLAWASQQGIRGARHDDGRDEHGFESSEGEAGIRRAPRPDSRAGGTCERRGSSALPGGRVRPEAHAERFRYLAGAGSEFLRRPGLLAVRPPVRARMSTTALFSSERTPTSTGSWTGSKNRRR